ncbi:MAG TPA: hypothetical protein PLT82_12360 [Candidatus Hydrogenedens sp.]|nr:hypothetical protein [Candidatus Hydrogenedens sp.]HOL20633.1 hypothetical protein [Candidatus Hydrogenedens sp.]HPP59913.1 hypothetical protein [Candidatus Hydrogenedens sp.]
MKKIVILLILTFSSILYADNILISPPLMYNTLINCSYSPKTNRWMIADKKTEHKPSEYNFNTLPTVSENKEQGLPRIKIKEIKGKKVFVYGTNDKTFVPRGFNHVVLEHRSSGWHVLFNTNVYNPDEAESTLRKIAESGGNTVRLWVWGTQNEYGFLSQKEGEILNNQYMDNVIDFLQRATKYNIYLIPILDEYPRFGNFEKQLQQLHLESTYDDEHVTKYNRQFFWLSYIRAKAIVIQKFIQYIKEREPSLLSTILAWSLQNEVYVKCSDGPFKEYNGEVLLPDGSKGSLATTETRQEVYDRTILFWANELSKAVKSVDSEALVTVGMWTSDSAGREPVSGVVPDGKDPRFPPRPSVLGSEQSLLDFIDIHIYPWDKTSKVNLHCHEHGLVKKPVIVGEYGVFQDVTIEQAKTMLIEFLQTAYKAGYIGDLYWVWDLTAVPGQTYSAVTEGLAQHVMQWNGWKQYFSE